MRRSVTIVAASIAVLVFVGACDDQTEQIASQNEAAQARTGTVPIFDLREGDCFEDKAGFLGAPELDPGEAEDLGGVFEVDLLECSDAEADIRVARLFTVPDGDWPGERYLDDEALNGCPGFSGALDDLATYFVPTEESWEAGDRTITCLRSLR